MTDASTPKPDALPACSADAVIEWVFNEGRRIENSNEFVQRLAHRLNDNGAQIDRLAISLLTLHPQIIGVTETWDGETDTTKLIRARHAVRESERYIGSPLQAIYKTGKRVRRRLDDLPEDAHRAYTELAEQGFTDYLALPILFGETDEPGAAVIISTRRAGGFSDADIASFRRVRDYLAPVLEVHALRHKAKSLMDTYVGQRTSNKVFAGMIKRGDADVINAALWFSDLRDFTRLTESLAPQQVLKMLNDYFEFVSAAVTANGGEILRFIGDAMLIVFPIDENMDAKSAARAALEAALDAQNSLATLNHLRRRHHEPEIEFGVGLNIGEVIYGNVGAPDRLDFTVMGPAVNRTARLESLTKQLGHNILFSREFADLIDDPVQSMGEHPMKGVAGLQAVFALLD